MPICTSGTFLFSFYRATLCVSVVFAVARCLFDTLVYCIQMTEDTVKLLSRLPHHSSFLAPSAGTKFQGEPLQ